MKTLGSFGGGLDSYTLFEIDRNRDAVADLLDITRTRLDQAFPSPDRWVFADPGGEFPQTYKLIHKLNLHLGSDEMIVRVRRQKQGGESLYDASLRLGTVPVMGGGSHTCSLKWKGEVLAQYAKGRYPVDTIQWVIGIEADELGRVKRFKKPTGDNNLYTYPLVELGITRKHCEEILEVLGKEIPHKSSCVFCPFMSIEEIEETYRHNPEAWRMARNVEAAFEEASPRKHQAWIDAGKPLSNGKRPRAPTGMWRRDSWADGRRLFCKTVDGKQLSVSEWEQHFDLKSKVIPVLQI